jgi:hypothetical protein
MHYFPKDDVSLDMRKGLKKIHGWSITVIDSVLDGKASRSTVLDSIQLNTLLTHSVIWVEIQRVESKLCVRERKIEKIG